MELKEKIKKLTRDELIELICNTGASFYITDWDINTARAKCLLVRAKTMADEAVAEMNRYEGSDHIQWFAAHKKFDRATGLSKRACKIMAEGRK